jgi:hypothetical protein
MFGYALAAMLLLAPPVAQAQQGHHTGERHAPHGGAMEHRPAAATEPGQGAFAAIQEIVGILVADPNTDWSTVNIDALRQHLVDMSNVTLYAKAKATPVKNGMRFEVTGRGAIRASIRRMVAAHAMTMNGRGGWRYRAEDRPEGAVMVVTVANPADLPKLRGLGFFGVLALGMHHQKHHLMIARGHAPHR